MDNYNPNFNLNNLNYNYDQNGKIDSNINMN